MLVIGDPQMTLGGICGKTKVYTLWAFKKTTVFGILAPKNVNLGHWTPPYDFWGHLEPKHFLRFYFQFWPTKNTYFCHWIPPNNCWGHLGQNLS